MRKLVAQYGKELTVDYADLICWQVAIPVLEKKTFMTQLTELFRNIKPEIQEKQVWVEFQDC